MSDHQATPTAGAASSNQLDFYQAMSDFKVMFPTLAEDIIEAVLRANNGAVDSTIDQLLGMSTQPSAVSETPNPQQIETMAPPAYNTISSNPPSYKQFAPPPPYADYADECDGTKSHTASRDHDSFFDLDEQTFQKTPLSPSSPVSLHVSEKTPFRPVSPMSSHVSQKTPFHPASPVSPHAPAVTRKSSAVDSSSLKPMKLYRRWTPAWLGELPADFLRQTPTGNSTPDTQTPETLTYTILQHKMAENERRRSHLTTDSDLQRHLDDEHLALMLQNAEFLQELRLDEEFMTSLRTDDMNAAAFKPSTDVPDLDVRRPNSELLCGYGNDEEKSLQAFPFDRTLPNSDEHARFRQQLKNMGGLSKRKFLDVAKKFFSRKKKNTPNTVLAGYDWQRERAGYSHLNESVDSLYGTRNHDVHSTPQHYGGYGTPNHDVHSTPQHYGGYGN